MQTFLDIVAADLYRKHNGDLADVTLVFPNKRASLFFNKALQDICNAPVWSPQYITISELFREQSTLEIADHIMLVSELHQVYLQVVKNSDETLDQFYAWGELMLSDFDDVDKHMANARQVFANLSDFHEMDAVDFLTQEQHNALLHFFSNFSPDHNSKLKERFLNLWSKLYDIYTLYRQRLTSKGIAYEGLLYRQVAEQLQQRMLDGAADKDSTANTTLVFVGFNLLNPVEQTFFSYYQKEGRAKFYWDYDNYYMRSEAGKYIAQYLKHFPNELPADSEAYCNFAKPKDISFITASTEDIQARYVTQWLTPERIAAGRRTAIVMADESLLTTVLHCLPPAVEHVNITTGYPLNQSPVTPLVMIAISLMQRGGHYTLHTVNAILRHPYAKFISPKAEELCSSLNEKSIFYPTISELSADDNLTQLFAPLADKTSVKEIISRLLWLVQTVALALAASEKTDEAQAANVPHDDFTAEALYRMYTLLNRMKQLVADNGICIEAPLFQKLLQQIINTTTIPFHGEPIEGIQVMGVLETRNLDFDHLLLLSCNDGNLPAKVSDSSFIPHSIRKAYELTTIDNKVAIYAFYFHRLLQRASDVSISYNSTADLGHTGDMSRFMLQMLAEYRHPIKRLALEAGQNVSKIAQQDVPKTQDIIDRMLAKGHLSPSALGKYLRCPLQFYYKNIAGIDDNNQTDEEELDQRTFGNIFHRAAECLYRPYLGRELPREFFDKLLAKGDTTVEQLVDNAFRTELFNIGEDDHRPTPRLGGLQLINRQMIIRFMRNMISYDRSLAPLTVVGVEDKLYHKTSVTLADGAEHPIAVGGIADRIDQVTGPDGTPLLRIIDYKTGRASSSSKIKSVEEIFDPANIANHSDYYLQAFLYATILSAQKSGLQPVATGLLFVQAAHKEDFDPILSLDNHPVMDISVYSQAYKEQLSALIKEIFDINTPFRPTPIAKHCETCAFAQFCK